MATRDVNDFQLKMKALLCSIFPPATVTTEWTAFRGEPGLYSPRIDLAVGPFATGSRLIADYNDLGRRHNELLCKLFNTHSANLSAVGLPADRFEFEHATNRNENARCFLAIEIENRVSNKHLMGGAINASALGRIGLAIAWDDANLRKFLRMRSYLLFLTDVGKNSFDPANLFFLTAAQLMTDVTFYIERHVPSFQRTESGNF